MYTGRLERGRPHFTLLDLTQPELARVPLQDALTRWLLALAQQLPVAIALDDIQRCDEPSAAWLAQAAAQSGERRLILLLTSLVSDADSSAPSSNALEVLCHNARSFELAVLNEGETARLLTSEVPSRRRTASSSSRVILRLSASTVSAHRWL